MTFRQLLQPEAMMLPSPASCHRAVRHGSERAPRPDHRIDMGDPDADESDGRERMNEDRNAFLRNGGPVIKVLVPDHEPCDDESDDQEGHAPEIELLDRIISPGFW